jgi:D-xylulose reductase
MEIWSWRLVCPLIRIGCALLMNSPLAIDLVERGLVDLKPLLTHAFNFTDALEAFEITKAGKDKDGKFVIKCVIDGPE